MLDPAIQDFLAKRKADWLKTKLKDCKTEEQQRDTEHLAHEKFALENWLPDAAKRAGWLAMVSHCGKFTHPSAKISTVIAESANKPDGFIRTGNVNSELDVLGNAAALDVYKFLSLTLADGQTVLSHLEQNTDTIKTQFSFSNPSPNNQTDLLNSTPDSFSEIQQGLLAIKQSSDRAKTSEKIKQVYFPVADDYHLLSLLTPSGILFKLKEHINDARFSDTAKQAREARRNQQHHAEGFDEFYNLTLMGFGGTKPQNVSILNSQNGGIAYLLPSFPPTLQEQVRKPKANFFDQVLYRDYQDSFQALHKLYKTQYNNSNIRDGIDNCLNFIIESVLNDQIIERMWQLRELEPDWSKDTGLSDSQKIWLDNGKDNVYLKQRKNENEWLSIIIGDFVTWVKKAYEYFTGTDAIAISTEERSYYKSIIAKYQEDLR